jgi:hypothetical protein
MNTQNPQARAARDALLSRSKWIVDNSIRVACGYEPVIPVDLADFGEERMFLPDNRVLQGLLKSVMPAIDMADDRSRKSNKASVIALEHCKVLVVQFNNGDISQNEYKDGMDILDAQVGMEERKLLTEYIANAK